LPRGGPSAPPRCIRGPKMWRESGVLAESSSQGAGRIFGEHQAGQLLGRFTGWTELPLPSEAYRMTWSDSEIAEYNTLKTKKKKNNG